MECWGVQFSRLWVQGGGKRSSGHLCWVLVGQPALGVGVSVSGGSLGVRALPSPSPTFLAGVGDKGSGPQTSASEIGGLNATGQGQLGLGGVGRPRTARVRRVERVVGWGGETGQPPGRPWQEGQVPGSRARLAMSPRMPLLLLWLLAPQGAQGCQGSELDRELVLAKVKALFLDALGPPALIRESGDPGARRLPRRHAVGGSARRGSEPEDEDVSQAILFPASDASCEDQGEEGEEGLFTHVFRPSQHTRSRQVTSAQLWFHTGLDRQATAAANSSGTLISLLVLAPGGPQAVPTSPGPAPQRWVVLQLDASALPLLSQPVLVLLLRCPRCSCSARPEATPFLVAHTRARPPSSGERARRSTPPLPWPWSPSALRLLQRPPEELGAHTDCHRAALNISFQELGWDRWIVYPSSFIFHYCHGGCGLHAPQDPPLLDPGAPPTPAQPLPLLPGAQACCAALPGTMRPLRVRTTSDGGYSFKYETVPNLLTQHCACI
ncbi:inhibin alpha chain [Erinaceus europaeus]|uniref:Inhibin alpha chain n=1 Tax=Erinaceus europaeus TaxID=9365 RepID=A0A1S3AAP7_ERIEU|nr:inhibin alpha chain [Erinaceus europaeus]